MEKKELVIDIKQLKYMYIFFILFYCLLESLFNWKGIKLELIIRIYYLIISLSLCIILKKIKNYYLKNIFNSIKIFFQFIFFMSLITVLSYIKNYNMQFEFMYMNMILILIELILISKIYSSYRQASSKKYRSKKILFCILIGFILICFYINLIDKSKLSIKILEIIVFSNFKIIYIFTINNFVKNQKGGFLTFLRKNTIKLDNLIKRLTVDNSNLEKSINLLKLNENRYLIFFRHMPHPMVIINSDNNRILFANSKFLKIIDAENLRDIINNKIEKYISFIKSDICDKNYNGVIHIDNKKRFILTKSITTNLILGNKIILIKDNTSNVIKEEIENEVKHKKLQESIRNEFLANISYDLKIPINVIYSASQIEQVYINKKNYTKLKEYNLISKNNCVSLTRLANNLIDISKIKSDYLTPRMKTQNLVELVEDNIMSLAEYTKMNDIELIFDTNTEECYIEIDENFIEKILLNIASNSINYTNAKGKIWVNIDEEEDYVSICIRDTGIGMDKELINKILNKYEVEKYVQNKLKSHKSLGLIIVKELVELQNGKINIESKINIGTNITITFKKGI